MADNAEKCPAHPAEEIRWACSACGKRLCGRCGPIAWDEAIFCVPCAAAREQRFAARNTRARRRARLIEILGGVGVLLVFALLVFLTGQGLRAFGTYRLAARYASDIPAAADFTFTDAQGKTAALSSLRGRVVVVDFWAGWCDPCLRLIPDLKKLNAEFSGQPFVLIGVNLDKTEREFRAAVAAHGVDWPQLWDDPEGETSIAGLYGVEQIPATLVIDKKGRIFKRWSLWDDKMSRYVRFLLDQEGRLPL